ncbi:hypothetical protein [uncultured Lacinutrix sp.]|uniref:hypothetical protein n=1 Tax=uncultured Lacinutrix sp. TaxID=574032 RepID=UPI0026365904|nr:hypothetical protein [uncultured Lacinutrix sp.]
MDENISNIIMAFFLFSFAYEKPFINAETGKQKTWYRILLFIGFSYFLIKLTLGLIS